MQNIIRQDIEESLQWLRQQMAEHGFDTSTPVKDIEAFFQAQEATKNMLDNEISDIADEYGEDSLEVEAAEDLQNDVEEGFREVEETTAERLKDTQKDFLEFDEIKKTLQENKELQQELQKQNEELQRKSEELAKEVDFLRHKSKYRIQAFTESVSKITGQAKDFANKTFDNVKQFCNDRKIDLFKAVDNARMKQNRFLKEFCLNTREMTMQSRNRTQEKLQACEDYLQKYQEAKKAKKAVINQFLKPFLPKKISEKYFSTDVNKIKFNEKTDYRVYTFADCINDLRKSYISKIDSRQKFMDKLEATIDKLDEKAVNIANKWQDKAKEPTQKSFEENLHRFEKEAEMENQNINPQRTQSQER